MEDRFRIARIEIGDNEFNERYRKVFNQMVSLMFQRNFITMVFVK